MRKFAAIVIILTTAIMMISILVACGGAPTQQSGGATPAPDSPTSQQGDSTDGGVPQQDDDPQPSQDNNLNYSLVDEVIVDDDNVTFIITSAGESRIWGFTLNVFMGNKTDLDLMFSFDNVSVNGFMIDPFWASEVAAGKKSNTEISFSSSAFERSNIISVDEITFTLTVYDSNDWMADRLIKEEFIIYPTGLDANSVAYPDRRSVANEQTIFDNDGIIFIIEETEVDSIWGYTLSVYLENKTDVRLMFSWDNVSVNGFMIDPFWATTVQSGKRSHATISFSKSAFEENGIVNVDEIEFKLRVYNADDWLAANFVEEIFTFMP